LSVKTRVIGSRDVTEVQQECNKSATRTIRIFSTLLLSLYSTVIYYSAMISPLLPIISFDVAYVQATFDLC
jgi:hypothetical protein